MKLYLTPRKSIPKIDIFDIIIISIPIFPTILKCDLCLARSILFHLYLSIKQRFISSFFHPYIAINNYHKLTPNTSTSMYKRTTRGEPSQQFLVGNGRLQFVKATNYQLRIIQIRTFHCGPHNPKNYCLWLHD